MQILPGPHHHAAPRLNPTSLHGKHNLFDIARAITLPWHQIVERIGSSSLHSDVTVSNITQHHFYVLCANEVVGMIYKSPSGSSQPSSNIHIPCQLSTHS